MCPFNWNMGSSQIKIAGHELEEGVRAGMASSSCHRGISMEAPPGNFVQTLPRQSVLVTGTKETGVLKEQ